jgi:hypothetical protein
METVAPSSTAATGGSFSLASTFAEPVAGTATGGAFALSGGFGAWDRFPPIANCQPLTIELADGIASISAADVDGGSTDNVSVLSRSLDITSFSAVDIGDQLVTLTITDHTGHHSTCTALVTVLAEPASVSEWMLLND